ncbi:MAG TPA: SDR family oxidoreductase [Anaerolineae bacterium]|nr:SDR family oxidoreductase [Anaerolineae bacterium]
MTLPIDSQVALITGALSDIGRATAQALAQAGYAVVLNYRHRAEEAAAFAAVLRHEWHAPEAIAIAADVRSRGEVQALYEQIDQALGRVDVLVNNAGINRDQSFLEMSDDEWETVVSTILTGTFICSQEFARRYSGNAGNIINIGAVTAIKGRKNGANYCSARAAILTLTKCLALELAPRIRVNTVTPGRIDTEELQTRYHLDESDNRLRLQQDVPLQRLGEPADVASMIAYLVTAGRYITGQNFFVDGGLFMR